MVKMIPPYLHPDVKSIAEKKLFDLIKHEDMLDGWVCFHSLGIAEHEKKVEGEIDFLLVGPEGVFCLEVKGGQVTREDGLWKFTDRYGRVNKKLESPFKQASSAMFSLIGDVKGKFSVITDNCMFGYGVVFPDIHFQVTSPEWSKDIIYDLSDRRKPFSLYLKRLANYWRTKLPNKRKLNSSEMESISKYIRGDFELVQPIGSKIGEIEQQVIRLTENQYRALDRMESNKRVFFRGTAGTGKTLLAMEKAKRLAQEGKKVLLLCYNKILGGKLNASAKLLPNQENITADSIHKYFYKIITASSLKSDFIQAHAKYTGDELYKKIYSDYYVRALNEVEQQFDHLIIDEGQDLLCYEYFSALDYSLKGGLEKGRWVVFYDSNNQGNLYQNYDPELVNDLVNFGAAEYWLDTNCRNTQHIATQTSVISGFKVENTLIREGEKVQFLWYQDNSELSGLLKKTVKSLISNQVKPADITVLYSDSDAECILTSTTGISCDFVKIDYDNAGNLPAESISYSTVQAYKGMENKVVIYLGVEEMDGDWTNTVNYVAMTRARQLLVIAAKESLKGVYGQKSINFLKGGL